MALGSYIPAILTLTGMAASMFGSGKAANHAEDAGKATQAANVFKARQYDQNAGQAVAASHIAAHEKERQAREVASRALAVAGAGGGGVSDKTVMKSIADIHGRGFYDAAVAIYQGAEQARHCHGRTGARRGHALGARSKASLHRGREAEA
mgnify:CR=1 FL=1